MADQDVTELTEDTSPSLTDLLYMAKDPAGTPLDRGLSIDTLRKLLSASNPCAKMTRDAAQSIPSGSFTKIAFDTEAYDVGSIADTGTSKFTIQESGRYLVTGFASIADLDSDKIGGLAIYLNGAIVCDVNLWNTFDNAAPSFSIIDTFDLVATDYLELYLFHNNGAAQNTPTTTQGKPRMSVIKQ